MINKEKGKKNKFDTVFSIVSEGSMSLEAALVLPVFIFSVISFIYVLIIINYQNIMQSSVNYAAKSIGRYTYVMDRIGNMTEDDLNGDLNLDKDIFISGINTGYAWKKIMTEEVKEYSEKLDVLGGINGISILSSKINEDEEGINDIRVNYQIAIDVLGKSKYKLRLSNRCYFRSWIGMSIVNRDTDFNDKRIVYITRTGGVYHLTSTCTYINISVSQVKYKDIPNLRNKNGAKYKPCEKCAGESGREDDIFYVTASGTRYHKDSKCSKIKRDVIAIEFSKVGNRKLCSRCEECNR